MPSKLSQTDGQPEHDYGKRNHLHSVLDCLDHSFNLQGNRRAVTATVKREASRTIHLRVMGPRETETADLALLKSQ